jgi:RNA polymerase sigma factor (sigma-70 family)
MSHSDKKNRAFTEIYSDYYPLVFSTVHAKINNPDAANDVAQEVFARFYEKFEDVLDARKWLYGAVRIVLLEYYRKHNLNEDDLESCENEPSEDSGNGIRETRDMIRAAIDSVVAGSKQSDAILFELIAVYDYSYKDAAMHLGMTEHQARYKYNQMSKKLLDYFKGNGINTLDELL